MVLSFIVCLLALDREGGGEGEGEGGGEGGEGEGGGEGGEGGDRVKRCQGPDGRVGCSVSVCVSLGMVTSIDMKYIGLLVARG